MELLITVSFILLCVIVGLLIGISITLHNKLK